MTTRHPNDDSSTPAAVKSADRVLDILELLAGAGRPMSHADIKALLGIPGSSLTHLLRNLANRNYIQLGADGLYLLGNAVSELSRQRRMGSDIGTFAQPFVERIAKQTGESTSFLVLRDGQIERVAGVTSTLGGLRFVTTIGVRLPVHAVAGGKLILALLPEDERKKLVAKIKFDKLSPRTIASRADFERDLDKIAEQGIAYSYGEFELGVLGIAVPVLDQNRRPVGSFSSVIPTFRDSPKRREEVLAIMIDAARHLEKSF
jgi:DNA-binding IclR family transcriptional regulator